VEGSESMQECLTSAELDSKTDPIEMGAPDYIGVYDSDERMIAIMHRNDTSAGAIALANVDNEMEADAAEKAEGDGWDVGEPSVDRSIAIGRYSIDFLVDPGSDAWDAVSTCVEAFTD
jgi:hypothetical protein